MTHIRRIYCVHVSHWNESDLLYLCNIQSGRLSVISTASVIKSMYWWWLCAVYMTCTCIYNVKRSFHFIVESSKDRYSVTEFYFHSFKICIPLFLRDPNLTCSTRRTATRIDLSMIRYINPQTNGRPNTTKPKPGSNQYENLWLAVCNFSTGSSSFRWMALNGGLVSNLHPN